MMKIPLVTDGGHVNSLERPWLNKILNGMTISIDYRIKNVTPPKYKSLDPSPGLKVNIRPMLFTGDMANEHGRWWPAGENCIFLENQPEGPQTYRMKIKPELWSSVMGKTGNLVRPAFLDALSKTQFIQLCFGGGNSFSHGIALTQGKVKFFLIRLTIQ